MIQLRTTSKVLITGARVQGKTTLAEIAILRPQPRVLVWDPTGFFTEARGYRVIESLRDLAGSPRVAYVPPNPSLEDLEATTRAAMSLRNVFFAVDEPWWAIDRYVSSRSAVQINRIFRLGHKPENGVGIALMTHYLSDLPRVVRDTDHRFFFHQSLPSEIEAARLFIGDHADNLPKLKPHYFIHQAPDGAVQYCIPVPLTPDSGPPKPQIVAPSSAQLA